jgi:hypothetical protein
MIKIIYLKLYCKFYYIYLSNSIFPHLRTLKCELASLINKENTYQMIIKEKSDAIRKLEKQLSDILETETSCNK